MINNRTLPTAQTPGSTTQPCWSIYRRRRRFSYSLVIIWRHFLGTFYEHKKLTIVDLTNNGIK